MTSKPNLKKSTKSSPKPVRKAVSPTKSVRSSAKVQLSKKAKLVKRRGIPTAASRLGKSSLRARQAKISRKASPTVGKMASGSRAARAAVAKGAPAAKVVSKRFAGAVQAYEAGIKFMYADDYDKAIQY